MWWLNILLYISLWSIYIYLYMKRFFIIIIFLSVLKCFFIILSIFYFDYLLFYNYLNLKNYLTFLFFLLKMWFTKNFFFFFYYQYAFLLLFYLFHVVILVFSDKKNSIGDYMHKTLSEKIENNFMIFLT